MRSYVKIVEDFLLTANKIYAYDLSKRVNGRSKKEKRIL